MSVRALFGLMIAAASCVGVSLPCSAASLLTGSVSAPKGTLEGVLVKATDIKSGMAVSVFSQADGRYSFPDRALKPGAYRIGIRASGYDLAEPAQIDLVEGKTEILAIRLKAADPSGQWNNAEYINALPPSGGAVEQRFVLNMCTHCHGIDLVLNTPYDQTALMETIARMSTHAVASVPARPVLRPDAVQHMNTRSETTSRDELALAFRGSGVEALAQYIAKANLSANRKALPYTPKALPLPKGDATKAVIRSWALPREMSMPHDVIVDAKGIVWYTDFGVNVLGRLDTATGAVKEYKLPMLKPDAPEGLLDIRIGSDGAIWLGYMYQGAVARFDPKTEKFKTWSVPKDRSPGVVQIPMVAPEHANVDGKVWMVDASIAGVHRLDIATGAFETFRPLAHLGPAKGTGFVHTVYGIASDPQNNLYFADWGESQLGRIDAKTGEVTFYPTPTAPSRPRRVHMDEQGRFWYAGWQGNAVGYLDTKTGKLREWTLPTPNSAPYDVTADAFGHAWSAGMASDRVQCIDIATGKVTEYLLPERNVNVRRVFVQNTKTGPIFWVGNNLGASIHAIQPLE